MWKKKPEKQYERRDQETKKKKEQSHVDTNFTQGQQ